jgi:hypothetical protein
LVIKIDQIRTVGNQDEPGKKAGNPVGAGKDSWQLRWTREKQLATNVRWITNVTYPTGTGSGPRGKILVVLPQRK